MSPTRRRCARVSPTRRRLAQVSLNGAGSKGEAYRGKSVLVGRRRVLIHAARDLFKYSIHATNQAAGYVELRFALRKSAFTFSTLAVPKVQKSACFAATTSPLPLHSLASLHATRQAATLSDAYVARLYHHQPCACPASPFPAAPLACPAPPPAAPPPAQAAHPGPPLPTPPSRCTVPRWWWACWARRTRRCRCTPRFAKPRGTAGRRRTRPRSSLNRCAQSPARPPSQCILWRRRRRLCRGSLCPPRKRCGWCRVKPRSRFTPPPTRPTPP